MNRLSIAGVALVLVSTCAQAQTSIDKGDWLIRLGGTYIDPSSSGLNLNGSTLTADGDASVTFNITYMMTRNLGIELLAALPFKHNLKLDDVTIGSTRQLPPTVTLQWHQPIGRVVPYVGIGVNWTEFFNERLLESDAALNLGDSRGLAAQIGFDFVVGERWLLNADFRYIDINTDVKLDNVELGTVKVDPWTVGLNLGFRFN